MTKQELKQLKAYYTLEIEKAEKAILKAEREYIETNAPYPVGAKVLVDLYKTAVGILKKVRVHNYLIGTEGELEPVFFTLEGKRQFVNNPTILKQIE